MSSPRFKDCNWSTESQFFNSQPDSCLTSEMFAFPDIYEDQFAKKKSERKEKVAKNELQRLRNLNRNMKGKSNCKSLMNFFYRFLIILVCYKGFSLRWR